MIASDTPSTRPPLRGHRNRILLRRLCRLVFTLVVLLIVAATLAEAFVIAYPQRALTIDSGNVTGDVIVVLGGQFKERGSRAAELYATHAAPRILITGRDDYLFTAEVLRKRGVPENAITVEPDSATTYENAKLSVPLLRQMGARRVIIVTSWYHSRRAVACFEHFAPDLQFFSRPSYPGPSVADQREDAGYAKWEEIKLPAYWILHGVCPF